MSYKQHHDMNAHEYNTLVRIKSVSNKNSNYGFENCDWQGTSFSRMGLCPAGPCYKYTTGVCMYMHVCVCALHVCIFVPMFAFQIKLAS